MRRPDIEGFAAGFVARALTDRLAHSVTVGEKETSITFPIAPTQGGQTYYLVTEQRLETALRTELDPIDFTINVLSQVLTEESSDELIDLLMKRADLPWWVPGGLVRRQLDKRLPEGVLDPIVAQLLLLKGRP